MAQIQGIERLRRQPRGQDGRSWRQVSSLRKSHTPVPGELHQVRVQCAWSPTPRADPVGRISWPRFSIQVDCFAMDCFKTIPQGAVQVMFEIPGVEPQGMDRGFILHQIISNRPFIRNLGFIPPVGQLDRGRQTAQTGPLDKDFFLPVRQRQIRSPGQVSVADVAAPPQKAKQTGKSHQ